jgi:hypothetical protein
MLLNLIGSGSPTKGTWRNYIDFPLLRYQGIIRCQQSKKWKHREIHRISSREPKSLDCSWEIRMSFCFVVIGLTLLFWVTGESFRVSDLFGIGYFVPDRHFVYYCIKFGPETEFYPPCPEKRSEKKIWYFRKFRMIFQWNEIVKMCTWMMILFWVRKSTEFR